MEHSVWHSCWQRSDTHKEEQTRWITGITSGTAFVFEHILVLWFIRCIVFLAVCHDRIAFKGISRHAGVSCSSRFLSCWTKGQHCYSDLWCFSVVITMSNFNWQFCSRLLLHLSQHYGSPVFSRLKKSWWEQIQCISTQQITFWLLLIINRKLD